MSNVLLKKIPKKRHLWNFSPSRTIYLLSSNFYEFVWNCPNFHNNARSKFLNFLKQITAKFHQNLTKLIQTSLDMDNFVQDNIRIIRILFEKKVPIVRIFEFSNCPKNVTIFYNGNSPVCHYYFQVCNSAKKNQKFLFLATKPTRICYLNCNYQDL